MLTNIHKLIVRAQYSAMYKTLRRCWRTPEPGPRGEALSEQSVLQRLADRAAVELARVAAVKPSLRSRCERAANILADHAEAPRLGVIRGQLRGGELVGYLVRGSGGAVYRVEARCSWRCSCPDHHGRHRRRSEGTRACKHGLAVWALWRASSSAPSPAVAAVVGASEEGHRVGRLSVCAGCWGSFRRSELTELHEDNHDDLMHFHGDLLCPKCCDRAGVLR
jgi:hypothetical protein